jgi:hypothetical protein
MILQKPSVGHERTSKEVRQLKNNVRIHFFDLAHWPDAGLLFSACHTFVCMACLVVNKNNQYL